MKTTKAIIQREQIAEMSEDLLAYHQRFYLLWMIGLSTGLRVSDLLTLTSSHVSRYGVFSIRESKTGNWREIKLQPQILQFLRFYESYYKLRSSDYLFYSREEQKWRHMSRQWAHRVIARTAKKRGLQSIGAHSMRKIYACELFRATHSIITVQAALGHKHLATTMLYLRDYLESLVTA